ncbi:MAG TPA: hypothetical protein VGJ86_05305 [Acidimicrobiales bacterium]|jgi:hypothetical protein
MGEALRKQAIECPAEWAEGRSHLRRHRRQRVFIEDNRGNGHYLRATWHSDRDMLVVSTWRDEVCTGAVRLPVEGSVELASLIIDGLAEAVARPAETGRSRRRSPAYLDTWREWAQKWAAKARRLARETLR